MVATLSSSSSSLCLHSLFSHSHLKRGLGRINQFTSIRCCKNNGIGIDQKNSCVRVHDDYATTRRDLLFQSVSAALVFPSVAALAADGGGEDFRVYTDEVNKFKIEIPQDWQVGNGQGDGVRAVIGFYPKEAASSNVSLVISGVGADYTKLESFGKVDAFAETLVGGIDRSWQNPPGVAAKLIDSKSSKGFYYIEYTLQKPGESRRHLYAVLGMADNGIYNRLYTLTGQFVDEEEAKFGSKIKKAVSSFRFT